MALLRGVGIPCRLHGSEVGKYFQRGATSWIISVLAPKRIVHTWVEVLYKDNWIALEGVITDECYVKAVKDKFKNFAYVHYGRKVMTRNVSAMRNRKAGKRKWY